MNKDSVIQPLTKEAEPLSQDEIEAEAVRLALEIIEKNQAEKITVQVKELKA
jgi:hypothetical protein